MNLGTFVMADWIRENFATHLAGKRVRKQPPCSESRRPARIPGSCQVLELGSATGALSIFMVRLGVDLTTSDADDGEIRGQARGHTSARSLPDAERCS